MKPQAASLLSLGAAMIGAMILVCTTVNPEEFSRRQSMGAAISILLGGMILPNLAIIAAAKQSYN
jgi:Na+/phosphate symporter